MAPIYDLFEIGFRVSFQVKWQDEDVNLGFLFSILGFVGLGFGFVGQKLSTLATKIKT